MGVYLRLWRRSPEGGFRAEDTGVTLDVRKGPAHAPGFTYTVRWADLAALGSASSAQGAMSAAMRTAEGRPGRRMAGRRG